MNPFSSIKATNSRQNWLSNKPITITICLFVPLILLAWWKPVFLSSNISAILSPLLKGEMKVREAILKNTNQITNFDAVELERLRNENQELRTLLSDNGEERVAAGVIGRPSSLPYDVLVIDRGTDDGVVEDAPVFIGSDRVIGFVAAAHPKTSVVAMITTPGWRSTVYIYGPNIYTTAVGIGGGITRVHVPQGIMLEVGNTVVIPSLNGGTYGTISAVDSIPSRPEQYGYVAMDTPISELRLVSVGTRPLSTIDFESARQVINEARKQVLQVPVPEGVLVDVTPETQTATTTEEVTNNTEENEQSNTD